MSDYYNNEATRRRHNADFRAKKAKKQLAEGDAKIAELQAETERLKQVVVGVRILAESLQPDLVKEVAWRDAWMVWDANRQEEEE